MPHTKHPLGEIPWDTIKALYITGSDSLRVLALKHGVSRSVVAGRCAEEKWGAERERYRMGVGSGALAYAQEAAARKLADKLGLVDEIADKMLEQLAAAIADPRQLTKHLVATEETTAEPGLRTTTKSAAVIETELINAKTAADLSAALKNIQYVKRLSKGLLPPSDEQKLAIERERLAMDQKKSGLATDDEGNPTGVLVLPAVDADPGAEALPDPAGDIAL